MKKLQCVDCGGDLILDVSFDGCDWDSIKGEGSGKYSSIVDAVGCTQ
jgi:hypothetical protein